MFMEVTDEVMVTKFMRGEQLHPTDIEPGSAERREYRRKKDYLNVLHKDFVPSEGKTKRRRRMRGV